MKLLISAAIGIMLSTSLVAVAEELKSPDQRFTLNCELKNGTLYYNLNFKDQVVVDDSSLGMELLDQPDLISDFVILAVERDSFDETWEPVWGEYKEIRNHYNEMSIVMEQEETGRVMIVRFRLFNDGLGFRYEFPEQENLTYFKVKEEHTEFAMTGDHTAIWIPGDFDTQEYNYTTSKLTEIRSKNERSRDPKRLSNHLFRCRSANSANHEDRRQLVYPPS